MKPRPAPPYPRIPPEVGAGEMVFPQWDEWGSAPQAERPSPRPRRGLKDGCPGWDRTSDILINSQTFYR